MIATPKQVEQYVDTLLKTMTRQEVSDYMTAWLDLLTQSATTDRRIANHIRVVAANNPHIFGGKATEEAHFWEDSARAYDNYAANTKQALARISRST
jgi:hypothetical protein